MTFSSSFFFIVQFYQYAKATNFFQIIPKLFSPLNIKNELLTFSRQAALTPNILK